MPGRCLLHPILGPVVELALPAPEATALRPEVVAARLVLVLEGTRVSLAAAAMSVVKEAEGCGFLTVALFLVAVIFHLHLNCIHPIASQQKGRD